jgi:response regulator NasT
MTDHRNILVIEQFDTDNLLETSLNQLGYAAVTLFLSNIQSLEIINQLQPDAVVLNLYSPNAAILAMLKQINQEYPLPVIMFAEDQQTETINKVIRSGVSAYIVDGLEPRRLKSIIEIAIARFHEQQALKDELQKTRNQLEDRKFIDQAKALLIKSKGYNEDQAYHALRKLAMDRKLSLGEMARNVVAMADLLK